MASERDFECWAETFGVTSMGQLEDAPLRIQKMLKKRALRNMICSYFNGIAERNLVSPPREVRIYANETEELEMRDCHVGSVRLIDEFIGQLLTFRKVNALEVAAGDGRLSIDLLRSRFAAIDCFDQCPKAVKKMEQLQEAYGVIKKVDQATMQGYVWEDKYSGIFLRWCIGYLTDKELKAFLQKASLHLHKNENNRTRQFVPESFIIVFDNVAPPCITLGPFDGQIMRNEERIENIFREAGLKIHDKSQLVVLRKRYRPVRAWALY